MGSDPTDNNSYQYDLWGDFTVLHQLLFAPGLDTTLELHYPIFLYHPTDSSWCWQNGIWSTKTHQDNFFRAYPAGFSTKK